MLGMPSAGKTTALCSMSNQEPIQVPTIGHNVEQVEYRGLEFNVWDVGGQDRVREQWPLYLVGIDALIFVVDSTDKVVLNLKLGN
jgi:ADP-ribosylation factor protein 1